MGGADTRGEAVARSVTPKKVARDGESIPKRYRQRSGLMSLATRTRYGYGVFGEHGKLWGLIQKL